MSLTLAIRPCSGESIIHLIGGPVGRTFLVVVVVDCNMAKGLRDCVVLLVHHQKEAHYSHQSCVHLLHTRSSCRHSG